MSTTTSISLTAIAGEINEHHRAAEAAIRSGLEHALEAGRLLIEAKAQCPHGTWGGWLADNFEGSERTAQVYMRVAQRWPEIQAKAQTSADLSIDGAVKMLAAPQSDPWPSLNQEVRAMRRRLEDLDIGNPDAIEDVEDPETRLRELISIHAQLEGLVKRITEQRIADSGAAMQLFRNGRITERDLRTKRSAYTEAPVPRLSPKLMFRTTAGPCGWLEIIPSLDHRGYYHVLYYGDIDTDTPYVEYDVKPARYTPELLTQRLAPYGTTQGWLSEPAPEELGWPFDVDGTEGSEE